MKRLVVVYFSPTHTSQKVVRAIAKGTAIKEILEVDMTIEQEEPLLILEGDLVIIGGPVYISRLPKVATERFRMIKGGGQPVVCVAVYGNNTFGDALIELADLMEQSGLQPIAGAGFIGEHSYANDHWHIADGRPNMDDLLIAKEFGQKIMDRLSERSQRRLTLPGKVPTEAAPVMPVIATVATDECTGCHICVEVCPVGAIDEQFICDGQRCIKCCACIKDCPEKARILKSDHIEAISERLSKMPDKLPELFL